MGFFEKFGLDSAKATVDWELTPADTFGMFESWGGKERVRSRNERFYYFFIDASQQPATVYLMERGIKYARVMARIDAPQKMIDRCVAAQGRGGFDFSYAIDQDLQDWLLGNVVDASDLSGVTPIVVKKYELTIDTGLSVWPGHNLKAGFVELRSEPGCFAANELKGVVGANNLYDRRHNPAGLISHDLYDNGDGLTVVDTAHGLMWQRGGCDINSIKTINRWVETLNRQNFAGYSDWRLPTIEEALAILQKDADVTGQYLHACFSPAQPFIFTADKRKPGGHWFVDYRQATVFWASAFNPGGFGRLCRSAS